MIVYVPPVGPSYCWFLLGSKQSVMDEYMRTTDESDGLVGQASTFSGEIRDGRGQDAQQSTHRLRLRQCSGHFSMHFLVENQDHVFGHFQKFNV